MEGRVEAEALLRVLRTVLQDYKKKPVRSDFIKTLQHYGFLMKLSA